VKLKLKKVDQHGQIKSKPSQGLRKGNKIKYGTVDREEKGGERNKMGGGRGEEAAGFHTQLQACYLDQFFFTQGRLCYR
jgi:hypothetical protein